MKDKLKIGIFGLGKFGKNYVNTLNTYFSNIDIAVACRKTNQRPDFLPESCGFSNNHLDVLNNYKLDGIISAMMPEQNLQLAALAMMHQVPILVEKPAAFTVKELDFIINNEYKNLFMVNYIHLFSEVFKKAQELIGNKQIISINSKGYNDGPVRQFSTLFDYAPHDFSMGLYLTKPKNIKLEYCQKSFNIDNDNIALYNIIVMYDNIKHTMEVGNYSNSKERLFEIELPNQEIIRINKDSLYHYVNGKTKSYIYKPNMSLCGTIDYFKNFINGEKDDKADLNLTLQITEIIEEIHNYIM